MSSKPERKDVPENTAIDPPVVSKPQGGGTYSNPVKFSGTGLSGWWVYFFTVPTNGDDIGSAIVDEQGNWTFDAYLGPGTFKVFGWQTDNRQRSPWTPFIEFTVTS